MKAGTIILPTTAIHVTEKLITRRLDKILNDKVNVFKKKNLFSASNAEIIGALVGYDTITNTKDGSGGFCDAFNKIICINNGGAQRFSTIFHEVAHVLQYETEVMELWFCGGKKRIFSETVKEEWQAESLAYKMHSELFGRADHRHFDAYFKKGHIEFLKNWYGDNVEVDFNVN